MGHGVTVSRSAPAGTPGLAAETEPFTAAMRDGVLWVSWNRSTSVTDEDARALVRRADAVCPGLCPPMLVQLNDMVSLSRCALQTFATELNIAAMAIVGPSAVDETLAEFFIQVHEPPYPTSHFTSTDEARTWLTEHPHAA
jgi:hypothetical protein